MMKKQEAIDLFGGKAIYLAQALGRNKSAISQWRDDLTDDQTNLVLGLAVRTGIDIPSKFINDIPKKY